MKSEGLFHALFYHNQMDNVYPEKIEVSTRNSSMSQRSR